MYENPQPAAASLATASVATAGMAANLSLSIGNLFEAIEGRDCAIVKLFVDKTTWFKPHVMKLAIRTACQFHANVDILKLLLDALTLKTRDSIVLTLDELTDCIKHSISFDAADSIALLVDMAKKHIGDEKDEWNLWLADLVFLAFETRQAACFHKLFSLLVAKERIKMLKRDENMANFLLEGGLAALVSVPAHVPVRYDYEKEARRYPRDQVFSFPFPFFSTSASAFADGLSPLVSRGSLD